MATPTQRRTSSSKGRRASHFALEKPPIVKDKSGALHLPHFAAPGATEYNGHPIHRKGGRRLLNRFGKTKTAKETTEAPPAETETSTA